MATLKTQTRKAQVQQETPVSTLFKPAENQQAYLKCGMLGFPGSGKTYTAYLIARGLIQNLNGSHDAPILFIDTETGSDFLVSLAKEDGIPFYVSKTRSFADLCEAVKEAERLKGVLIIDSVTHFWTELQESYKREKKRTRLYFQDWGPLKETWRIFTDLYVNGKCHVIMNGRAGYEYDYGTDADGVKQLEKTGTKMQVETNMGYEPSLLVEMVREPKVEEQVAGSKAGKRKVEGQLWNHVAYVLKDRTRTIEGARFENPTFEEFAPAIMFLNLDGSHLGVDTTRTSQSMFKNDAEKDVANRIKHVNITLEEIQGEIVNAIPGSSAVEKKAKADILKGAFGTFSWSAVESMKLEDLETGLTKVRTLVAEYVKKQNTPAKAG
jgi:hypothetical protein